MNPNGFDDLEDLRADRERTSDARLAAAIEYVARRLAQTNEHYRGAVKLNKILWWADTESHRRHGFSITGSEYQRLREGPVPYQLPIVRRRLEAEGRVRRVLRDIGAPRPEQSLEVLADDEAAVLDERDKALLDEALEFFRGKTGKAVSDWSHKHSAGWRVLEDGDLIPHQSWLVDVEQLGESSHSAGEVEQMLRDNSLSA